MRQTGHYLKRARANAYNELEFISNQNWCLENILHSPIPPIPPIPPGLHIPMRAFSPKVHDNNTTLSALLVALSMEVVYGLRNCAKEIYFVSRLTEL